jgi:hypothetical protein
VQHFGAAPGGGILGRTAGTWHKIAWRPFHRHACVSRLSRGACGWPSPCCTLGCMRHGGNHSALLMHIGAHRGGLLPPQRCSLYCMECHGVLQSAMGSWMSPRSISSSERARPFIVRVLIGAFIAQLHAASRAVGAPSHPNAARVASCDVLHDKLQLPSHHTTHFGKVLDDGLPAAEGLFVDQVCHMRLRSVAVGSTLHVVCVTMVRAILCKQSCQRREVAGVVRLIE